MNFLTNADGLWRFVENHGLIDGREENDFEIDQVWVGDDLVGYTCHEEYRGTN